MSNNPTKAPARTYISGPMSGHTDLNFPAFNKAAATLRWLGMDVVNPAEIDQPNQNAWADCLRVDIAELVKCHAIYLLPGWDSSEGAKLEAFIAAKLGMHFMYADGSISAGRQIEASPAKGGAA